MKKLQLVRDGAPQTTRGPLTLDERVAKIAPTMSHATRIDALMVVLSDRCAR